MVVFTSHRLKEEMLTVPSLILRMKGCLVASRYIRRCLFNHVSTGPPSSLLSISTLFFLSLILILLLLWGATKMNSSKISSSKLSLCLKAPVRFLCKARDFYVKSMTGCASRVHYGATGLPKSFSVNSSSVSEEEDIRELMRAFSQRNEGERMEDVEIESKGLPKSFSMGIGKIDEDKPCYFQDDFKANSDVPAYLRSKSYAVGKRTRMVA